VDSRLWKISIKGGKQPLWAEDGSTLYYSAGSGMDRQMMSVTTDTEGGFAAGQPQPIFEFTQVFTVDNRSHALHPDGTRFLTVNPHDLAGKTQSLIYVQNWLDEVERLVPTGR